MTASDFFFVSAGLSIWIVLSTWVFIFYKIIHIITETELKIKSVKNTLKLSGLTLLSKILGLTKGGENNASKK
jgi:hypothetical protein